MMVTASSPQVFGQHPRRRTAMCRNRLLIATLIATGLGLTPALAGPCGKHEELSRALGDKYGENRQSLGLSGESQVFELFVSARGSWTLLATDTKGKACIVAAGEAWQNDRKVVAGLES
jgi:hypothetical protein